jgi:hypothetical protein
MTKVKADELNVTKEPSPRYKSKEERDLEKIKKDLEG